MPVGMSYDEMLQGYRELHHRLFDDRGIASRIRAKLRYLRKPAAGERYGPFAALVLAFRFLVRVLGPGGPRRWWWFARSVPWLRPSVIPRAIEDWVVGVSMRSYIERHFQPAEEPARHRQLGSHYVRRLEAALARYREAGALEISLDVRQTAGALSLRLRGWLDRRFYTRAARHLERLLRETRSSVTLHVDQLHQTHVRHLQRLLRRLSRYGDRIRITLDERVRGLIQIDSSVFLLSFEGREIEAR